MKVKKLNIFNIETSVDDRGYLRYCNSFNLKSYTRFYDVVNYQSNFIRAWHGHKQESKAAIVREGSAMICLVEIDNWNKPSKKLQIKKFFLSNKSPKILEIPAGCAHGFMSLEPNTKITFYSNKRTEESLNDDYRFSYNFWNPWNIKYR
jgi:dTDP-4-dehydrorhamnose 3,5-epimerase-like enzyme